MNRLLRNPESTSSSLKPCEKKSTANTSLTQLGENAGPIVWKKAWCWWMQTANPGIHVYLISGRANHLNTDVLWLRGCRGWQKCISVMYVLLAGELLIPNLAPDSHTRLHLSAPGDLLPVPLLLMALSRSFSHFWFICLAPSRELHL